MSSISGSSAKLAVLARLRAKLSAVLKYEASLKSGKRLSGECSRRLHRSSIINFAEAPHLVARFRQEEAFSFPARWGGQTSQHLSKHLKQPLPVRFLSGVKAVMLQGFLNLLVMDYFHAAVRRLHEELLFL
jgi:hypothetical protein